MGSARTLPGRSCLGKMPQKGCCFCLFCALTYQWKSCLGSREGSPRKPSSAAERSATVPWEELSALDQLSVTLLPRWAPSGRCRVFALASVRPVVVIMKRPKRRRPARQEKGTAVGWKITELVTEDVEHDSGHPAQIHFKLGNDQVRRIRS